MATNTKRDESVTELPVAPADIAAAQTEAVEDDVTAPTGQKAVERGRNLWALDNDSRIEDRNGNSLLRPSASVTERVQPEQE